MGNHIGRNVVQNNSPSTDNRPGPYSRIVDHVGTETYGGKLSYSDAPAQSCTGSNARKTLESTIMVDRGRAVDDAVLPDGDPRIDHGSCHYHASPLDVRCLADAGVGVHGLRWLDSRCLTLYLPYDLPSSPVVAQRDQIRINGVPLAKLSEVRVFPIQRDPLEAIFPWRKTRVHTGNDALTAVGNPYDIDDDAGVPSPAEEQYVLWITPRPRSFV